MYTYQTRYLQQVFLCRTAHEPGEAVMIPEEVEAAPEEREEPE